VQDCNAQAQNKSPANQDGASRKSGRDTDRKRDGPDDYILANSSAVRA